MKPIKYIHLEELNNITNYNIGLISQDFKLMNVYVVRYLEKE